MSSHPHHHQQPRRITKVRQACDCCHARKIRCDGTNPCANCLTTELQCTYLAVPKKKGPKGRRVTKDPGGKKRVINRPFPTPPRTNSPLSISPLEGDQNTDQNELPNHDPENVGNPGGPARFQPSPMVTIEVITRCVDAFFTHKYPITPILDKEQTYALLPHLSSYPEEYGLITACCAMIVLSPDILAPSPPSPPSATGSSCDNNVMPTSEFLISETIRARQYCNHIENPSLATVQTSFFLFAALFCLGKDNSAWFYIRESMTLLQLLRLHEESTYSSLPDPKGPYAIYSRRTFWLLFITERAYALQRHRPLTLQRMIVLPTVDPGPESVILSGFLDLVSLFQNFDDDFLAVWNVSTTDTAASPQSLVRLQDILKFAIPNVSERTEMQQADLLVSRQWLKTMVWQLCVAKGLLSSSSTDESMRFQYPVTIARDVVLVTKQLPSSAFEANGVGILEKVFDIGCSLADVLLVRPELGVGCGMQIGPRDYLLELVQVLGTVLGGTSKYLSLLANKAEECLQVKIQGNLSLGSSDDSHGIHEILDDEDICEDEVVYQVNAGTEYVQADFQAQCPQTVSLASPFGPVSTFDLNHQRGFALLNSSSEAASDELAPYNSYEFASTQWDRILEDDGMMR